MANDAKKYSHMEPVLQQINKNFVSLPEDMKKQYNIYQKVVKTLIDKMKETNPLFCKLYRELFYGGSYYDGLKISKPEEFDLDLLLKLPDYAKPELTPSDLPGFVKVRLNEFEKFQKQPEYTSYYTEFPKILDDDHYLDAENVKKWMESVINKTLNKFEKSGDQKTFICEELESENKTFFVKMVKGGPAFTLQITNPDMRMDVDLVPCFVFDNNWPSHCNFKKNPCPALKSYFIVPKKPHGTPKDGAVARCWRMSFQIQERELIKGRETLKPALKLLKKFRDTLNHVCISSYFLKTVFLFEVQGQDLDFCGSDHSTTFIQMLNVYYKYLEKKHIPYYWNERHNMIGHIGEVQLENVANKVRNVIKDINRNVTDPFVVAKYILDKQELEKLKEVIGELPVCRSASASLLTGEGAVSVTARNLSTGPTTNQPISQNQIVEQQLQALNVGMREMLSMQKMLLSKTDALSDRVRCLELKVNNLIDTIPTSDAMLQ